jgi:hypothetical protein
VGIVVMPPEFFSASTFHVVKPVIYSDYYLFSGFLALTHRKRARTVLHISFAYMLTCFQDFKAE